MTIQGALIVFLISLFPVLIPAAVTSIVRAVARRRGKAIDDQ